MMTKTTPKQELQRLQVRRAKIVSKSFFIKNSKDSTIRNSRIVQRVLNKQLKKKYYLAVIEQSFKDVINCYLCNIEISTDHAQVIPIKNNDTFNYSSVCEDCFWQQTKNF